MSENHCTWRSVENSRTCNRVVYKGTKYCLFHKPNKSTYESAVFWKVINWSFPKDLEVMRIPMSRYNLLRDNEKKMISDHIQQSNKDNFTLEEQRDPSYEDFFNDVKTQVEQADIWARRRTGMFDGFIFSSGNPQGVLFTYKNKFPYSPISFDDCVFQCSVSFDDYMFLADVSFNRAVFKNPVHFFRTKFFGSVSFCKTNFRGDVRSPIGEFYRTEFKGSKVDFSNAKIANFGTPEFGQHTKIVIKNLDFGNLSSLAETVYRVAKTQSLISGDYDAASEYAYLEMKEKGDKIKMMDRLPVRRSFVSKFCIPLDIARSIKFRNLLPLAIDRFNRSVFGYGERPARVVGFSVVIIFLFSFLFYFSTCHDFLTSLFISSTTFSGSSHLRV